MKKSEWEKLIRHEVRKVVLGNFIKFRNDMNNKYYDTFMGEYLPKIVEEVHQMYLEDR